MIDSICEKMEIEKEEVCDLLCAAIKKMCKTEEDEESSEEGTEGNEEDDDQNND